MKVLKSAVFLFLFISASVFAQGNFGLGIMVGEPTGLSFKYFMNSNNAIDGGVAWSFKRKASLHIHADYLFHSYDLISVGSGKLPVYYGIGGRIRAAEDAELGLRIPVGMSYIFPGNNVDIFVELVPVLDLIPETDFSFNGAIGVRYYF